MARRSLDLDEALVERAMRLFNVPTEHELVDLALRRLVGGGPLTIDEQLELRGIGWDGDLDDLRSDRGTQWSDGAAH